MHGISPFKFAWCFGFHDNLTYCLSHPLCKFALDAAIPSMTTVWIFDQDQAHVQLVFLRDSNCKSSHPTHGQHQQHASSHLSTAPLEHDFHLVVDGLMLITTIPRALPFAQWSWTQAASAKKL
jgi:hypothetical protein